MRLTHNQRQIAVMRAMQGGPIAHDALAERMGGGFPSGAVSALMAKGFIERYQDSHLGQAYKLTPAGRASLPSRREAAAVEVVA